MSKRRAGVLSIIFAACVWISGCESAIPKIDGASPAFSHWRPDDLAALDRGRSEYIAKCSGCHVLYVPSEGDATYWNFWVGEMASRSKLALEEKERIEDYLAAVASGA